MSNFPAVQTELAIQFFLESSVTFSNFHSNRRGNLLIWNPVCPTSTHTDLEINFLWNPVWPISTQADFEIQFSWNPDIPIPSENELTIHFFWNLYMLNFHSNTLGNSIVLQSGFLEFGLVTYAPKQTPNYFSRNRGKPTEPESFIDRICQRCSQIPQIFQDSGWAAPWFWFILKKLQNQSNNNCSKK